MEAEGAAAVVVEEAEEVGGEGEEGVAGVLILPRPASCMDPATRDWPREQV